MALLELRIPEGETYIEIPANKDVYADVSELNGIEKLRFADSDTSLEDALFVHKSSGSQIGILQPEIEKSWFYLANIIEDEQYEIVAAGNCICSSNASSLTIYKFFGNKVKRIWSDGFRGDPDLNNLSFSKTKTGESKLTFRKEDFIENPECKTRVCAQVEKWYSRPISTSFIYDEKSKGYKEEAKFRQEREEEKTGYSVPEGFEKKEVLDREVVDKMFPNSYKANGYIYPNFSIIIAEYKGREAALSDCDKESRRYLVDEDTFTRLPKLKEGKVSNYAGRYSLHNDGKPVIFFAQYNYCVAFGLVEDRSPSALKRAIKLADTIIEMNE